MIRFVFRDFSSNDLSESREICWETIEITRLRDDGSWDQEVGNAFTAGFLNLGTTDIWMRILFLWLWGVVLYFVG